MFQKIILEETLPVSVEKEQAAQSVEREMELPIDLQTCFTFPGKRKIYSESKTKREGLRLVENYFWTLRSDQETSNTYAVGFENCMEK